MGSVDTQGSLNSVTTPSAILGREDLCLLVDIGWGVSVTGSRADTCCG